MVSTAPTSSRTWRPRLAALGGWLLLAGLFLTVFAGRALVLREHGSDLPAWDQWDGEGTNAFVPYLRGELTVGDLFRAHNEHRIAATRVLGLALLELNGQWDQRLEAIASAALAAGVATVLFALAAAALPTGWRLALAALAAALFAPPIAWENVLAGFQSQFYLLALASLGGSWLLLRARRLGPGWAAGVLLHGLGFAAMASGFLAPAVTAAVIAGRAARARRWPAVDLASIAAGLAFLALGLALRVTVPGHAPLAAQGAGDLVVTAGRLLAWPNLAWFPVSVLLAAPAVAWVVARARAGDWTDADWLKLLAVLWIGGQLAAIAWARGHHERFALSPRYFDLLAVHVVLNFALLADWARRCPLGWSVLAATAAWVGVVGAGIGAQLTDAWRNIDEQDVRAAAQIEHTRAYLATGDPAHLRGRPVGHIPYPDAEVLLARLAVPELRAILPSSVRAPAAIEPSTDSTPALVASALPPKLAEAAPARVFGSVDPAATTPLWRSRIQPDSAGRVLRFQVAGDLGGDPGLQLVVRTSEGATEVRPPAAPGLRWRTVNVVRPPGPWWIEARDESPRGWFAFSAPVEGGWLSWHARNLLKDAGLLLAAGLALIVAGGALRFLERPDAA